MAEAVADRCQAWHGFYQLSSFWKILLCARIFVVGLESLLSHRGFRVSVTRTSVGKFVFPTVLSHRLCNSRQLLSVTRGRPPSWSEQQCPPPAHVLKTQTPAGGPGYRGDGSKGFSPGQWNRIKLLSKPPKAFLGNTECLEGPGWRY